MRRAVLAHQAGRRGQGEATGVTLNDVVLAMCAGALRAYLIEQNALPDRPLIAMVPVSLRSENDTSSGGNMVGTILCSLATDVEDPANVWTPSTRRRGATRKCSPSSHGCSRSRCPLSTWRR